MAAPIEVTFMSDGLRMAGHLRIPSGELRVRPGLVFTGPLYGVKEQVTGNYAEALASAGYVTLAFNHRGFGDREGTPPPARGPRGQTQ